jgi:FkbM family methyltransferase
MNSEIGGRAAANVLNAPFNKANYAALFNIIKLCPTPLEVLYRYLTSKGSYPYVLEVRTPIGILPLNLFHAHDLRTVNEVFFRHDYAAPADIKCVIDLGSNIGISAAYFLTRNTKVKCYLFEPLPANVEKLKLNLSRFEGRFELSQSAVSNHAGRVTFHTEPTGRYGTLLQPLEGAIDVDCQHINQVLEQVLAKQDVIDILKIDIEGLEESVIAAIDPQYLNKIKLLVYELPDKVVRKKPSASNAS